MFGTFAQAQITSSFWLECNNDDDDDNDKIIVTRMKTLWNSAALESENLYLNLFSVWPWTS